jgi:hypothetical protein
MPYGDGTFHSGQAQTNFKTMAPFVKSQAAFLAENSKIGVGRHRQPTNISWSDDSEVAMKA